jgi:serine/threonine-protein kinase
VTHTVVEGPDPLLGRTIAGRYTVMKRLARGGMGVVYLAVQEGLGRAVALKVIRKEIAADELMQRRFEREAKAASQLSHPSIVTVFDYGKTDDGGLFLAMELVEGENLRDALKRRQRLAFDETLPIIESILHALSKAHAAGVVHRDLKPENVMLPAASASTTGLVAAKVLDFGLAKPHDPGLQSMLDERLTAQGGFVGTPGYAAPEQAQGDPEHPRQDLYALGIVWWELLTGAHPFEAPTPMKVVARQLVEDAPRLPDLPGAPAGLAPLVRSLIAKAPADRPASARDVLTALRALTGAPATPTGAQAHALGAHASAVSARGSADARGAQGPSAAELASSSAETVPGGPPAFATTVAPPAHGPAGSALMSAPPRSGVDGPRRIVPLVMGLAFAAFVGALVAIVSLKLGDAGDDAGVRADAGHVQVVAVDDDLPLRLIDAGPLGVRIIIEGVPRFSALRALVAQIAGARLERYTVERSLVLVDGTDTAKVAEMLQGRALETATPLVLEVKEVDGPKVVMRAVPPEEASELADAGPGALDAGAVDRVVAPGGLTP